MYSYNISHPPFFYFPSLILEAFIFHTIVFLNSNLLILSQALTAEQQNTALEK